MAGDIEEGQAVWVHSPFSGWARGVAAAAEEGGKVLVRMPQPGGVSRLCLVPRGRVRTDAEHEERNGLAPMALVRLAAQRARARKAASSEGGGK